MPLRTLSADIVQPVHTAHFHRTSPPNPPLPVADYAAQALISTILAKHFPEIPLIGEEDANDLRTDDQQGVKDKIIELANGALANSTGTDEDQKVWDALGREARSTDQWLESIDRGNAQYSNKGRELEGGQVIP